MAAKKDGDGKVAEGKFTEHMKLMMKNPLWWHHRFPDAAVCMGRIPAQPSDDIIMYKGNAMLVEVKESKSETTVPGSRFTQSPKMTRFVMAGGQACFLVYFRYAKEPYWIIVSLEDVKNMDKSIKTIDPVKGYKRYREYQTIAEAVEDIRISLEP